MKIIDLLNKVTTGELKEKVVFEYSCNDIREYWTLDKFFEEFPVDKDTLNYEVGIIKEIKLAEDKKIDPLGTWFSLEKDCENDNIQYANANFKFIYEKINEIIDKLNEENKQ